MWGLNLTEGSNPSLSATSKHLTGLRYPRLALLPAVSEDNLFFVISDLVNSPGFDVEPLAFDPPKADNCLLASGGFDIRGLWGADRTLVGSNGCLRLVVSASVCERFRL